MNLALPKSENVQVRSISKEVDYAWLAGILDGEGALSVRLKMASSNGKNYLEPKIRIYNTDVRMIQKCAHIYSDLNLVYFYTVNIKKKASWKNQLGIVITSQASCLKLIEAVEPYLCNKKDWAKAISDLIIYTRAFPKGGNTSSFDYTKDDQFMSKFSDCQKAKVFHIDPLTTVRRARTVVSW